MKHLFCNTVLGELIVGLPLVFIGSVIAVAALHFLEGLF